MARGKTPPGSKTQGTDRGPGCSTAIRVALYTRVSTDQQASREEGSLETQESRLRSAALARAEHIEIGRVFREEGVSGKSLDRPELQRLMAAIRAGEIDRVMVTRLDRLSRSLLDFYELNQLFDEHGVEFYSIGESFDTSTPVGRAMLKLVLVFAELEREQTAERTRVAFQARAERGLWNGGRAPLGYDVVTGGKLVVSDDEGKLVRLIFDQYLEQRSTNKLAKWLTGKGHRPKYSKRGRGFTPAGVRHILKSRVYLGEIGHKGETYDGQHDALVNEETWARAQAIMATHARAKGAPRKNTQYDYLLTGLVTCTCGHALTPSSANGRGGRYHYYRCVGIQKKTLDHCDVKQVRAEELDKLVLDVVRDAARNPDLLAEAVEEANRMAREQVSPLQERAADLKRELGAAQKEAEQLLRSILGSGVTASATAKRMLADAENRHAQLTQALAEIEGQLSVREAEHLNLELVVAALKSFDVAFEYLDLAERRELLQLMIQGIQVEPEHIEVQLYEGGKVIRLLDQIRKKRSAGKKGGKGSGGRGRKGPSGNAGESGNGIKGVGGDPTDPTATPTVKADWKQGPQNDETPAEGLGFVLNELWLPVGRRPERIFTTSTYD